MSRHHKRLQAFRKGSYTTITPSSPLAHQSRAISSSHPDLLNQLGSLAVGPQRLPDGDIAFVLQYRRQRFVPGPPIGPMQLHVHDVRVTLPCLVEHEVMFRMLDRGCNIAS